MGARALFVEMIQRDIRVFGNPEGGGVFCVVPGPESKPLPRTDSSVPTDLPKATDVKALIDAGLCEVTGVSVTMNRCYRISSSGYDLASCLKGHK